MKNFLSDVGLITLYTIVLFIIKKVYDYFYFEELRTNAAPDDPKGEQTIIPGNSTVSQ